MITKKITEAFNSQLNAELYSAYLYLSMSAYLSSASFSGAAQWMRAQAKEESEHAMKFYDYLLSRGAAIELTDIAAPPGRWDGIEAVFDYTCKHEKKVTAMIVSLMDLAKAQGDEQSQEFLQWFVDEQVEEEEHTGEVLAKVQATGGNADALAKLDAELGERQ